jgi:hypothetical protein
MRGSRWSETWQREKKSQLQGKSCYRLIVLSSGYPDAVLLPSCQRTRMLPTPNLSPDESPTMRGSAPKALLPSHRTMGRTPKTSQIPRRARVRVSDDYDSLQQGRLTGPRNRGGWVREATPTGQHPSSTSFRDQWKSKSHTHLSRLCNKAAYVSALSTLGIPKMSPLVVDSQTIESAKKFNARPLKLENDGTMDAGVGESGDKRSHSMWVRATVIQPHKMKSQPQSPASRDIQHPPAETASSIPRQSSTPPSPIHTEIASRNP